jgi:uncharacterized protein YdeI (YjbR/CyaY-like superfamily)
MATTNQKTPTIDVFTIDDFQKWLRESHKKEDRVAVIIYKKHTGKSAPTHRELVEQAICYGWIDTTIKRLDDDRFIRHFSKRTKNSSWSRNTLSYAQKLVKEGRMQEQGLHFYELGLKKKTHDHGIPENPDQPIELKEALSNNKKAETVFNALPPSTKKMVYRWFLHAKRPETRAKRINQIITSMLNGDRDVIRPATKINM